MDRHRTVDLPLTGILAAAAMLRLFRLGHQSLWVDEWFSYNVSKEPLAKIWTDAVSDAVHPPLYYFLLHPIASRTPNEFWLRLPSVLFGVLVVWMTYQLAVRLTDRPTALVAAGLLAVSAFQVYHSQETRMYMPLTCFGLVALIALWEALQTGSRRHWGLFVLGSTLSLYTNYLAAALAVTAAGAVATHWRHYRASLKPFAASAGLIVLLFTPWLYAMSQGGQSVNTRRKDGSPKIAAVATAGALLDFTVGYWKGLRHFNKETPAVGTVTFNTMLVGLSCALALLYFGFRRPLRDPLAHTFLVHCVLGGLIIGFLVATQTHFKQPRYFDLAAPAVTLTMAAGLIRLFRQRSVLRYPLLFGLLAATLLSVGNCQLNWRYGRDDWKSVLAFLEARAGQEDLLVFNAGWMDIPFNHYVDLNGRPRWPVERMPTEFPCSPEEVAAQGQPLLERYDRIWLVLCYDAVPDPEGLVRRFFDEHAAFLEQRQFSGVTVRQYDTTTASQR